MRPVVSWMTRSDDAILEFYDEKDISAPPLVVSFNLSGVSHPTVKRRVKELSDRGLLKRYEEPRGFYEITDKGRSYLRGELEADELEEK
jgi:predicted transcriptional regulator